MPPQAGDALSEATAERFPALLRCPPVTAALPVLTATARVRAIGIVHRTPSGSDLLA